MPSITSACLTAVTLDGKVLWQIGRPDPRNGLLTNDTPFQIHDIDGDGKNEVVLVRDFQLQVLDGATGKMLPARLDAGRPRRNKERPYEINNGDSIAFVNLSGGKTRSGHPDQGPLSTGSGSSTRICS